MKRLVLAWGGPGFVLWYALFGLSLLTPSAVQARPIEVPELARVNQRWQGARCRLRYEMKIKRGRNSEGWSRAPHMMYQSPGERVLNLIFEVSDRAALERAGILRGGAIPVGTDFIAKGWGLLAPEDAKGVFLELRFADAPVDARWLFIGQGHFSPKSFPLSRLDEVERYMRLQAFAIAAADEQLVETPKTPAASASPAGPGAARSGSRENAYSPMITMVAVAAQPAEAVAGGVVALVLTYEVSGIPPGARFLVVERREIDLAGHVVAQFEQKLQRVADTFTSTQQIRIPATASSGLYTVRGTATMAGLSASGTALLAVRASPDSGHL